MRDDAPSASPFRGASWRAPYAADPAASRGRLHPQPESPLRSVFASDRDRVVHSSAFRRLKHKTQVFVHHEGDHYRTRLSHSLEVAQVARAIARPLGLDEDLAETLALAHDLGHPPFGHAGERALDRALDAFGGFDHNVQALRVVTRLEQVYPSFDGLNLAWETLEGLVRRDCGAAPPDPDPAGRLRHLLDPSAAGLPDFDRYPFASAEAQVAAMSDDIAYAAHDLEDGLRAGLIGQDALAEAPLAGPILRDIAAEFPGLGPARTTFEMARRVAESLIADVVGETARRLDAIGARSADDVRAAAIPAVAFTPEMAEAHRDLKDFLFRHLYRSAPVMRRVVRAEGIVSDLFAAYLADPGRLPPPWRIAPADPAGTARRIADYLAGMTDRFAVAEHRRLFDATPDLG